MSVPSDRSDTNASHAITPLSSKQRKIEKAFKRYSRLSGNNLPVRQQDRGLFFAGARFVLGLILAEGSEEEMVDLLGNLMAETKGMGPELSPH